MNFESVKFKNAIWFTIIIAIVFSIFGFALFINIQERLYSDINSFLKTAAISVSDSIDILWENEKKSHIENNSNKKALDQAIQRNFNRIIRSWIKKDGPEDPNFINIFVQIYDKNGQLISSSTKLSTLSVLSPACLDSLGKGKDFYEDISLELQPGKSNTLRFLATPISVDQSLSYIIRVAIPLNTVYFALQDVRFILFLLIPFTIILTGIISSFLTNRTLKPVDKIIKSINQIKDGNLKTRLEIPETNDEIKRLAETFNDMINRLDESFTSQHKLIEDLSHEIKTPLSVLKGQFEVSLKRDRAIQEYKSIIRSSLEEVNRIIQLSENLLLISLFEVKNIKLNIQNINLSSTLSSLVHDFSIMAEEKEVKISHKIEPDIYICGDMFQIKSMIINLLVNAIKYNIQNGKISVLLQKIKNQVEIKISDTGLGIPEEQLPFIFDRYYRVIRTKSSSGFGLGLNIVKCIVDIHKGKIEVESQIKKGSCFTIHLPLLER